MGSQVVLVIGALATRPLWYIGKDGVSLRWGRSARWSTHVLGTAVQVFTRPCRYCVQAIKLCRLVRKTGCPACVPILLPRPSMLHPIPMPADVGSDQGALAPLERFALQRLNTPCLVVDWEGARVAVLGDVLAVAALPTP